MHMRLEFFRYGGSFEHLLESPQDVWGSQLEAPPTHVRRHPARFRTLILVSIASRALHRRPYSRDSVLNGAYPAV